MDNQTHEDLDSQTLSVIDVEGSKLNNQYVDESTGNFPGDDLEPPRDLVDQKPKFLDNQFLTKPAVQLLDSSRDQMFDDQGNQTSSVLDNQAIQNTVAVQE